MSRRECNVCLEIYNHEEHVPRFLTCGHSICTSCLGVLLKDKNLMCPQCRTPYRGQVNSVNDVPVAYDLLPLPQESSRETIHPDDIFRSLKATTNTFSVKTLALTDKIESLRAQLSDLNAQVEINDKVKAKVNKQLDKNKEIVLNEVDYVKEAIDIALAARESMMDSQQAVKEATTFMDLFPAYEEAKKCCETSEKSLQRNQMMLQRKVLENSQKSHSAYETFLEKGEGQMEEPQPEPLLSQPSTSSWKEPKVFKGTITKELIETELHNGKVWAVTTWNGNPRYAQLFDEGYHFLLHCFQDGKPPAASLVLEYERVCQDLKEQYWRTHPEYGYPGHGMGYPGHGMGYPGHGMGYPGRGMGYPGHGMYRPTTVNETTKFYLELSWGNEKRGKTERKGKVWIESHGTDKPSQFFQHLCLGDKGPSYLNTRMKSKGVDNFGSEYVIGGEGRDKDDRKDLFRTMNSGLDAPHDRRFGRINVWDVEMSIDDDCLGTFYIYAEGMYYGNFASNNFVGKVCDGFELVEEILELNIKDVLITDCGTQIPKKERVLGKLSRPLVARLPFQPS